MFRAIGWVDSHKARAAARGGKAATIRPSLSVLGPLPSTDDYSARVSAGEITPFRRAPFSHPQVAVCDACLPSHPCPLYDPNRRVLSRAYHTEHALRRAEKRRRRVRFAHKRPR